MKNVFIVVSITFLLASCVSLKEVNSFAEKATASIGKHQEIYQSFSSSCTSKCQNRIFSELEFVTDFNCDCSEPLKADKNLNKVLKVLQSYFKQLSLLSNSKLSEVSFSRIEKPLVEGKYFKKSALKPYENILQNIIAASTNNYRASALENHLAKTSANVDTLLSISAFVIKYNLIPSIHLTRQEHTQIYHDLHTAEGTSNYDKFTIKKAYFNDLSKLDAAEKSLLKYVNNLDKIKKGLHEIYINKHRLKHKEVRALIQSYAESLDEIMSGS